MENSENEVKTAEEVQFPDLRINFSGDNKVSTLVIPAKDCYKVSDVLAKILTENGIECRVEHSETPKIEAV